MALNVGSVLSETGERESGSVSLCCFYVYQGSLEIKSLVTTSFENNVLFTLNPKLNLTDSVNKTHLR